jgi:lipopolysaccharide transport system ATP-binding protein
MTDIAVRVENLSKSYRIGAKQEAYKTLRDTVTDALISPFRKVQNVFAGRSAGANISEEMWALKDLSFDIKHGDVVGIIGRNGAGKSTLLKILSRITEPSLGYADIYGRVGALLEVGTGFHPELTGRENIYLNGTILGMGRKEINRKFDEIVDFSGIEKFIDTPVKHYSSGMGLRLGFAVAAHLEPDILIVDEVLAVGDAEFQKKCLGKMGDVASEGRTILFVSHNMGAVSELCKTGIVLNKGKIAHSGEIRDVVASYIEMTRLGQSQPARSANLGQILEFTEFSVEQLIDGTLASNQAFSIKLGFRVSEPIPFMRLNAVIVDATDRKVSHLQTDNNGLKLEGFSAGSYSLRLAYPPMWLSEGVYGIGFKIKVFGLGKYDGKYETPILPVKFVGERSVDGSIINPRVDWNISKLEMVGN